MALPLCLPHVTYLTVGDLLLYHLSIIIIQVFLLSSLKWPELSYEYRSP